MPQNIKKLIIETIKKCPNERIGLYKLRSHFGKKGSESQTVLNEMLADGSLLVYRNSNQDVVVNQKNSIYYKTLKSVGADVPALVDVVIKPGEQVLVPSVLLVDGLLEDNQVAMITARSGFFKPSKGRKLILTNGVGIIDPDYPNNVAFSYYNVGENDVTITAGEPVGQVVVFDTVVDKFPTQQAEREGGFGSTDKEPEVDEELTDDAGTVIDDGVSEPEELVDETKEVSDTE